MMFIFTRLSGRTTPTASIENTVKQAMLYIHSSKGENTEIHNHAEIQKSITSVCKPRALSLMSPVSKQGHCNGKDLTEI